MALDAKIISRTDAEALIPEEYSREIIQNVPQRSRLLPMMRRLPNMSRKQYTIPVLSALPQATFVNGEANGTTNTQGQKSTTMAEWSGLTLTAEELAVIVPIPEAVLDDADYDTGICSLSSELSKGLEFDAVILTDASEDKYSSKDNTDMKNLYVSMTRPLHELEILYDGELTLPLKKGTSKILVK